MAPHRFSPGTLNILFDMWGFQDSFLLLFFEYFIYSTVSVIFSTNSNDVHIGSSLAFVFLMFCTIILYLYSFLYCFVTSSVLLTLPYCWQCFSHVYSIFYSFKVAFTPVIFLLFSFISSLNSVNLLFLTYNPFFVFKRVLLDLVF